MTDTPERELIEARRIIGIWLADDVGYYESLPANYEIRKAIEALLSRVDKLEEALNAIIDRALERDIKWAGMTARDIAIHTLNRSAS